MKSYRSHAVEEAKNKRKDDKLRDLIDQVKALNGVDNDILKGVIKYIRSLKEESVIDLIGNYISNNSKEFSTIVNENGIDKLIEAASFTAKTMGRSKSFAKLSDKEAKEVSNFFAKNKDLAGEVDWDRDMSYEDFKTLMDI